MKKVFLLLTVLLIVLLGACSADMDPITEDEGVLIQILSYDYSTGTFNNAPGTGYLKGLNDYSLEFFALYDIAKDKGYVSESLTQTQITAYEAFFTKLETLDDYNTKYFDMDSSELTTYLESRDITVEPIDIFTFNAIKNTFEEMNYSTVTVRTPQFLEILLDRSLTSIETEGLELLDETRDNYYYNYYESLPVTNYAGTIEFLDENDEATFTDDDLLRLQAFFDVLEILSD